MVSSCWRRILSVAHHRKTQFLVVSSYLICVLIHILCIIDQRASSLFPSLTEFHSWHVLNSLWCFSPDSWQDTSHRSGAGWRLFQHPSGTRFCIARLLALSWWMVSWCLPWEWQNTRFLGGAAYLRFAVDIVDLHGFWWILYNESSWGIGSISSLSIDSFAGVMFLWLSNFWYITYVCVYIYIDSLYNSNHAGLTLDLNYPPEDKAIPFLRVKVLLRCWHN